MKGGTFTLFLYPDSFILEVGNHVLAHSWSSEKGAVGEHRCMIMFIRSRKGYELSLRNWKSISQNYRGILVQGGNLQF